ncbi:MAG: PEP-CTERM sorting domain-containing protein [Myxococcota bacterium]
MISMKKALLLGTAFAVMTTGVAQAQTTHSVTGELFMGNPSAGATRELTIPNPDQVTIPQIVTLGTAVASPTSMQGPGLTIQIPADQYRLEGSNMRTFMSFPSVAQNTEVFTTTHAQVTFAPGAGVGTLSWCPQITGCGTFMNATVATGQGFVGAIPGPNTFGGAFRLLRSITGGAWFVFNPGTATPTKTLGFSPNVRNQPWSAGLTNGEQIIDDNPGATIYTGALLGANGSVANPGNLIGPGTFDPADGIATGFKMTTGTMFFSDATPTTTMGGPFTSSQAGYDQRTNGGEGNIQLIGGAVAYAGFSGNVFFRITRLNMAVPEPAALMGLGAGAIALAGLAVRRRNRA